MNAELVSFLAVPEPLSFGMAFTLSLAGGMAAVGPAISALAEGPRMAFGMLGMLCALWLILAIGCGWAAAVHHWISPQKLNRTAYELILGAAVILYMAPWGALLTWLDRRVYRARMVDAGAVTQREEGAFEED